MLKLSGNNSSFLPVSDLGKGHTSHGENFVLKYQHEKNSGKLDSMSRHKTDRPPTRRMQILIHPDDTLLMQALGEALLRSSIPEEQKQALRALDGTVSASAVLRWSLHKLAESAKVTLPDQEQPFTMETAYPKNS